MGTQLKEMEERYSEISLKFAEVEGERQQLVMALRNFRNGKNQNSLQALLLTYKIHMGYEADNANVLCVSVKGFSNITGIAMFLFLLSLFYL